MQKIKDQFQKHETLVSILLIALVTAVTHLVHAAQFGIYRDSWFLFTGGHIDGPAKFFQIWSIDRPGVAYLFAAAYSLLGDTLLAYNLAIVSLRFLGALGLLWALRMLWPKARVQTLLVVLLFIVYPGFIQLPNSMEYLPHITSLALFIFSVAFMIKAIQTGNRTVKILLILVSLVFTGLYLFLMEYYVGMEGLRLALLWLLVVRLNPGKSFPRRAADLAKKYLPFAIVVAAFLYWRVFIFSNTRSSTDIGSMAGNILRSPLLGGLTWLTTLIKDYFETAFFAWTVPPYTLITSARLRDLLAAGFAGLLVISAIGLTVWLIRRPTKHDKSEDGESQTNWSREAILIGAVALVIALTPASFSALNVAFDKTNYDRFTLPGIIAACLLMVGIVFAIKNARLRGGIFVLLITLGVMTHYINGVNFANNWKNTRETWWQLTWRAPSIKSGTMLLGSFFGSGDIGGNAVWPATLIYHPQPGPLRLASEVLNPTIARYLLDGRSIPRDFRSFEMNMNFGQALILARPESSSCLHIFDGTRPDFTDADDFATLSTAKYSDINLIDTQAAPAFPPVALLGAEPTHGWCYYFEKASLARQRMDWQEIVRLGNEAASLGLRPDDYSEWIPFILGFAFTGDFASVDSLIPILKENLRAKDSVCTNLEAQAKGVGEVSGEDPGITAGREYILKTLCGD
jgi:hypothetical protein